MMQHSGGRQHGGQIQAATPATLGHLSEHLARKQVQDDLLQALAIRGGLACPNGFTREYLLLLSMALNDLLQGSAFNGRRITQLLHQPRMRQHERNRVAVVIRARDRLANKGFEIAGPVADTRPFPGPLDTPAMHCNRLELVIQPTDAQRGGFTRDRVGGNRAPEREIKHNSGLAWCVVTLYASRKILPGFGLVAIDNQKQFASIE